jgi:glycerate 2-kinase
MSHDASQVIKAIYAAAVDRVRAGEAVRRSMEMHPDRVLEIAGTRIRVPEQGIYIIAIGKASLGMCTAAAGVIGEQLVAGIVVTKEEHGIPPERVRVLLGSHPVPDGRSVEAGNAILRFARSIPPGAVVLCLISGGGSALVESPRDGVSFETIRDVTHALLGRGASIREINAVRSRLSRLKAGGLLRELHHAEVHNLIVSDVLGDDLQSIASGPTVQFTELLDPAAVLDYYGVRAELPAAPVHIRVRDPHTAVIANVSTAIDAAAQAAASHGYRPFVLTHTIVSEARDTGSLFAGIVRDSSRGLTSLTPGTCLIAGGEMVVSLRGNGIGGRNTEAALAAALALQGSTAGTLGFIATDGDDGVSGAAGAIVDGGTIASGEEASARSALRNNDSYTFLCKCGATYVTGPTGTNVNDLVIGVIG